MKKNKYVELTALKGRMREEKTTYRILSKDVGLSLNALNSKLNGHTSFNLEEASRIVDVLKINPEEITKYFFPTMLRKATKTKLN